MATFNRYSNYSSAGGFDKRDPREDLIVRPAEDAQDKIKTLGIETLGLLSLLPKAFAHAQRRELKRLAVSGKDENDPRVVSLKASLERAAVLEETAVFGQTRLDHFITPADRALTIFSGFVSDSELRPLAGVRVQVSEPQAAPLSAVTDAKGFFSIELGKNPRFSYRRDPGDLFRSVFGGKPDLKNAAIKAEAAAAAAEAGTTAEPIERFGRIELFDNAGKRLHEDPQPLPLEHGNVYREYLLASDPVRDPKYGYETGPIRDVRANPTANLTVEIAAPAADAGKRTGDATSDVTAEKAARGVKKTPPVTGKPAANESAAAPAAEGSEPSAEVKPGTVKTPATPPRATPPKVSTPKATGPKTGGDKDKP